MNNFKIILNRVAEDALNIIYYCIKEGEGFPETEFSRDVEVDGVRYIVEGESKIDRENNSTFYELSFKKIILNENDYWKSEEEIGVIYRYSAKEVGIDLNIS